MPYGRLQIIRRPIVVIARVMAIVGCPFFFSWSSEMKKMNGFFFKMMSFWDGNGYF
jgi:hypothetical protein